MENIKLISRKDVMERLTIDDALRIMEKVYAAHGNSQVLMPSKITLDLGEGNDWPPYGGSYNAMPAYIGEELDMSGIKWVWGFNDNPKKGLPYISAVIILNDPHTGEVLSIMDGSYITDVRTGASAGVAAKYLKSSKAKSISIIGAGVIGRMSLRAISRVMEISEVRVKDLLPKASEKYANELSNELNVKVIPVESNEEACLNSDIVVTATIADEPLVMKDWLKKGCTVLSLGSFQELDENILLSADKLIVDNWSQNAHRGELRKLVGEGRITEGSVFAEMPELVTGRKIARYDDDEIICACIIGMGSTDIGVAGELYRKYFENANVFSYSLR